MPETRITAHLPTIDIELMHCELPEQNADLMTVQIRATPHSTRWSVGWRNPPHSRSGSPSHCSYGPICCAGRGCHGWP